MAMLETRRLNEEGLCAFRQWLDEAGQGEKPPSDLLGESKYTEPAYQVPVDVDRIFASRYEFGVYLVEVFSGMDAGELLDKKNDGLWAWLAIVYFEQLAPGKRSRPEHYMVIRSGLRGSLAYRQGPRTCYELTKIHGDKARVCLNRSMKVFGDMTEQLASRQSIALNKGFFEAACKLYVNEKGQIRLGAASRPKKQAKRKPGDMTGFGGADRLALSLQRLDLTYDTEVMGATNLIGILPREFSKWTAD